MIQQITFIIILVLAVRFAARNYRKIVRNIRLGMPFQDQGEEGLRWRNVLLIAFGQKKMFKNMLPAVMHFAIYAAFLVTQIELLEILIDGFTGKHRIFAEPLGRFYTIVISSIEVLSLLAFGATIVFLARRNVLRIPRFTMPEMNGWPFLDANLILVGEIVLIISIFMMNGADTVLQEIDPAHYPDTGHFALTGTLGPAIFANVPYDWLFIIERAGWWLHLLTVLAFLNYLPYSKHLHIAFAFPNVYWASPGSMGQMNNMPEVMNEVKSMLGLADDAAEAGEDIPDFGANDVFTLPGTVLLGAYACTECGRCTAQCPANITGKKLSPRKIMMDIRDRAAEVGSRLDSQLPKYKSGESGPGEPLDRSNYDDGKSLFDYITDEEIFACTTCNACVEACPVMINPLEAIIELRRYRILTDAGGPSDWTPMFTSLENSGSVWQMSAQREDWTQN